MSTSNNSFPTLKANLILKGKIECVTGLHIGGSKEKLEIGGLDSPVIRDPNTRYPYIPGSSIKGKMRHLLEYVSGGLGEYVEKIGDVSTKQEVVSIFGIGADIKGEANEDKGKYSNLKNVGLSRLLVRDALPDKYTTELWENLDTDLEYTEYKPENTIDRLTSAANPRFIERVVAGSRFDFEMVYTVYERGDQDESTAIQDDLDNILMSLRLLESTAIGKSGSRGYGKIKFYLEEPHWLYKEDYKTGNENYRKTAAPVAEDIKGLKTLADIRLSYEG